MLSPADVYEASMLQLRRAEASPYAVAQPLSTSGSPLVPLTVVRQYKQSACQIPAFKVHGCPVR